MTNTTQPDWDNEAPEGATHCNREYDIPLWIKCGEDGNFFYQGGIGWITYENIENTFASDMADAIPRPTPSQHEPRPQAIVTREFTPTFRDLVFLAALSGVVAADNYGTMQEDIKAAWAYADEAVKQREGV